MSMTYAPLPYSSLNSGVTYLRPRQQLPDVVNMASAASEVMTDLTKVALVTVGPCATIAQAEQRMIASGVRLLLVTNERNEILGLITTTDLYGEKPMLYCQEKGCKREEIFVRDIMTSQDHLEVLHYVDVVGARVGDVVETLKRVGRQHALVVEQNEGRQQVVRGIFSTKQIGAQLGIPFETTEVAKTFAEVEATLA